MHNIGDSKFNVFMQTMEGLVDDENIVAKQPSDVAEETIIQAAAEEAQTIPGTFYNDDDVKEEEARDNLFSTTSSFISQLTNI